MLAYRFFVDREIVDGEGGDHVRVIDVPADEGLLRAAELAGARLVQQRGEDARHPALPAAQTECERARKVAEKQLEPGEEITHTASVNIDDVSPSYGVGLPT